MQFFEHYSAFFVKAVLFVLLYLIVKYYFNKSRLFLLGSRLPGPRPWPIIGNALEFLPNKVEYFEKLVELNRKYGFTVVWIVHELYVIISTPEDAEIYFTSRYLLNKGDVYKFLEPILGKGLITANGTEWKKARKFIEATFRHSSLQSFTHMFEKQADILLQNLEKEKGKKSFSVHPFIKKCTCEIVFEATLPQNVSTQYSKYMAPRFIKDTDAILTGARHRGFVPWQKYDFMYKLSKKGKDHFRRIDNIKEFIDSNIKEERISRKEKILNSKECEDTSCNKTLFERFFYNEEWDDDALRDHIITMIGAGYETSALAISFALIMLGIHADVQQKLYEELSVGLTNEKNLHRLEYLEMVIKETLRLFPPVPYVFRKAEQDVQMGEHLIPKGATVVINIFSLHRSPKSYENPEEFNPDNFLPENIQKRHPYSFLPFAMGSRMCVGYKFALMTIRVIISKIVRNYKIECDLKMEDIKLKDRVTLKMTNGLYPIRLIKR